MIEVTDEMFEAFARECRHHSGWQTLPRESVRRGLAAALARKPVGDVLNYVNSMIYPGTDGEWHLKSGYDHRRVLDELSKK